MTGSMNIKIMLLTGILKLFFSLMSVDITVLSDGCVLMFELIWRLLADPVGLPREGADTDVRIEGFSLVYKF